MLDKFVVVDVGWAEAIEFVLLIALDIKLERRLYVTCHTELKLYLLASGQLKRFPQEIILRF